MLLKNCEETSFLPGGLGMGTDRGRIWSGLGLEGYFWAQPFVTLAIQGPRQAGCCWQVAWPLESAALPLEPITAWEKFGN